MHVTEPPLAPLDTARTSVPMSDAEFDSLLGSAEFQDLLGPADGGNGAGPGTDALTDPLGSDFAWAGDKSLDAFLGDGTGSPAEGTRPASADDLASGLQAPSTSSDPMRLDPTLPISDVAELANAPPPADTALNRSYASAGAASGGPPSGCATPTAISEAGARFADAALSPPDETLARASAGNGATSSQSESVEMGRGPSPGVASGAVRAWPAAGPTAVAHMGPHLADGAGPGPPLAPHMQPQPPHLMSNGAAPGGSYGYGGYYSGGGGMPFGMPVGSQHPAMKGSRGANMAGGPWPMQWGPASAPMQAPQQMWPADQLGMWAQQPGAYAMQPGGGMAGPGGMGGSGKQFGQYRRPLGGVPRQALRSGSEVWSSSGSGQSSQSGFHHPTLLGVAGPPQAAISQQQPQQHTPQRTIQSGDVQLRAQQQAAAAPMDVQQGGIAEANAPQGGQQHSLRSHSAKAQRPRSTRRAAQRNSHDASPQLKASSAPEVQPVPASPQAAAQAADQQAAALQQAAVLAPPGAFYPGAAPHNVYCMPGQGGPRAGGGNMFAGQPVMPNGGVASMTGLPAGGMAAGGTPAFPPVPAGPGFGGSRSQPVSPLLYQQHSAPVAMTTTPRAASKRGSASFGELGGLSPRGGSSKNRGAYSQPGTPRSEALVLEELKALIGQLDPATKATMKNSLYRISRNAAGSGTSSDAGVAAEAAAKAAKKPDSPDEVGPVDRLVADLLYKEPLQQAPNLPQQLAETARAQQEAAQSHRWTQSQQPPQAA